MRDDTHRPAVDRMRAGGAATGGGRVTDDGGAHWIPHAGADGDGDDGVDGWLAVPVVADGRIVAVLRFVPVGGAAPAGDLLRTMTDVGRQLGVLIERNQARQELEALNRELQRSNRELEQFAYVASHDLQEPLRKITGFTDLLLDRHGDQLDGDAGEFLDIIVDAARRMRQLITDLLAYSRAGRRRPGMGPVALDEVVGDALADLQPRIRDTAAQVDVAEGLPTVRGNRGELRELLVNLVGNALKYHGRTPPVVTVTATPSGDGPPGWWRLTVADEGIGIDPAHRDRIFDVFQRLHPRASYEGTGIGLAVCRQIVDHHGGRIRVDSAPGEGAAFHVTLPPSPGSDDADG